MSYFGQLDGALSNDSDEVDFGGVFDDDISVTVVIHAVEAQDGGDGGDGLNELFEQIGVVRGAVKRSHRGRSLLLLRLVLIVAAMAATTMPAVGASVVVKLLMVLIIVPAAIVCTRVVIREVTLGLALLGSGP